MVKYSPNIEFIIRCDNNEDAYQAKTSGFALLPLHKKLSTLQGGLEK